MQAYKYHTRGASSILGGGKEILQGDRPVVISFSRYISTHWSTDRPLCIPLLSSANGHCGEMAFFLSSQNTK